jgi:hypothetical protein
MGSLLVVVGPPVVDDGSCIDDVPKPLLIQSTIAEAPVEGLDERVLSWFAGLNQVQLHLLPLASDGHCLVRQFGPVIYNRRFG